MEQLQTLNVVHFNSLTEYKYYNEGETDPFLGIDPVDAESIFQMTCGICSLDLPTDQ